MSRVTIHFLNIGSYHAARLHHVVARLREHGIELVAVQSVDSLPQHPWGRIPLEVPVETLVRRAEVPDRDGIEGLALAAARVPALLDRIRPAVVVLAGWGHVEMRAGLRWCRRRGVPAICLSETKSDDQRRRHWKERLKYAAYIRRFEAALVGGTIHRDYLVHLGYPTQRIFLGYDVVDNDYFGRQAAASRADLTASRRRNPLVPGRPYFLASGRFVPRKNYPALIEAYAGYRRHVGAGDAWDLVLCGSGREEPQLRAAIARAGVTPHVHLPGFITYHALGDWYGHAAAFVHPALAEPWGLVINEACASGLPIICSRNAGARYDLVRDGQNGFLIDPGSIADMTSALQRCHNLSPQTRAAFGARSEQLVACLGLDAFGDGLLGALRVVGLLEKAA